MKRKLSLLLVAVLSLVCLFAVPAYADGDVYTADDVLHYDGLATRVKDDVPGIRSMYSVNKKAVAYLESEGYTVAYGAVMAIGEKDGTTVDDEGVPRTARTLTIAKTATGYKASGARAAAVTVYETGNPDYATGLYLTNNASGATFAYTTTYTKAENQTVSYLEGTQLCYAGFVALTKDGETTYTYDYAEGNEFGTSDSVYGVHTSVYEVSEYFLNDYRATDADEKSPFAENATLRRTVATCGIVIDHADMKKNGTATEVAADATAGTDATYVVKSTGTGNGVTFTVPNAKAGMYSLLVRATNNALVTSDVGLNANGRLYLGRIVAGQTAASSNYAVSSTDGYRDLFFHVMLDEGDNSFNFYIVGGSSQTPIGIAGAKLVMDAEISGKDVVLGGCENLTSGPSGYTKNEKGTGIFANIPGTAFAQSGSFTYAISVPADGEYRMVSLSRFGSGQTVTATVKDGDGNTVDSASFTTTQNEYNNGSRAVQFVNKYGKLSLKAGEYSLTVKATGQIALSNIALLYVEPTAEDTAEKTTTFDFLAKEQTLSSTTTLTNGTVFMTRSSSLKMTVKIEQAGVYLLSGKHNTAGGKIHYLTMTSNIDTAHGMESRLFSSSSVTTYNDKEDFLVEDTSTDFATADALGYMYLSAGTHTLTLKIQGSSGINGFGIYNLRLALATAQTDGSIRISGQSYDTESSTGVTNPSPFASGVRRINGTDGYAEYKFTPTVSGIYNLNGLIADRYSAKSSFTVKDASGNAVSTVTVNIGTSPYVTKWPQGKQFYGFGDASTAPIETSLMTGVYLTAGSVYTIAVDTLTANSILAIADLRLILVEADRAYYEKVDVDFASGAIDASTGEVVEEVNSFVTEPLLIEKAGTTLRLVTTASKAGALTSANLAVMAYTPAVGGYIIDPSSPLNVVGGGYATGDNTVIGAGYIVYTVTTTEDNTVLRFSCMAKEASQIGLYYVSDEETAITVADLGDVDMSTSYVFDENAIGADIATLTTTLSVSSPYNGKLILLAYDKGDYLIGTAVGTKDSFLDNVTLDFTSGNYEGKVASLRAVLVDGTESYTLLADTGLYDGTSTRYLAVSDFAVDGDYIRAIGGNANAVAVHPEDMTASANVTTLPDGTLLLVNGSSVSFTVNAEREGLYLLDMKMIRKNGFINKLIVKNNTYTAWNTGDYGYGLARIGTSGTKTTATADTDYAIGNTLRYGAFDGTADNYVYLLKGENKLTVSVDINVSGNKLGLDAIRLVPHTLAADASVTLTAKQMSATPSGYTNTIASGSIMPNNGHWLKPGSTVYFTLEIPEDGTYEVSMLGSGGNGVFFELAGTGVSFLPLSASASGELGASSTSTKPYTLGKMNLKEGSYTAKITVTTGQYLHYNLFLFNKVAAYDPNGTFSVADSNMDFNQADGSFTYTHRVIGVDPTSQSVALTERIYVTGKDKNGEFSYTLENIRDAYETEVGLSGTGREGLVSIAITYALYYGNTLLYEEKPFTYDLENELKVFFFSDTHYTGLSEGQLVYTYDASGKKSVKKYDVLKSTNTYTKEYDVYGWASDNKLQRVIDEVVEKYRNGEFDIFFILGDEAMTDGNYHRFEINNCRYANLRLSDPNGVTCNGYWRHPLNESYVIKTKFFSQLSAEGIPCYFANGNHDYVYTYNNDKTDLDYTEWERLYHYAELFGHRTDTPNGKYLRDLDTGEYIYYEDSDSVDYLVRAVMYKGEKKILSALSTEELAAFKERYKGDGNCYDFYVSEDILETDPDNVQLLGAFIMGNSFQIDTYNKYTNLYIQGSDFSGQTIRSSFEKEFILRGMMENCLDFGSVFYVTHLANAQAKLLSMEYGHVDATFYGDVHTEEYVKSWSGSTPAFVAGHVASCYDIDYYMTTVDFDGNDIAATADSQYFYSRGNAGLDNRIWGDFSRHPFNYIKLTVYGNLSKMERVHLPIFYENKYQVCLTYDEVTGMDVRYVRAVADAALYEAHREYYVRKGDVKLYTYAELQGNTDGYRKVFVGGDVGNAGTSYMYLTDNYVMNEWDNPEYVIGKDGSVYTTAWVKVGTAYESENGAQVAHPAAFNASTDEGTVVYVVFDDGVTESRSFTMRGTIGDHAGHYLYDEKGDFVYVDTNGYYVFYDAQEKREGYIEASIQEQYQLNDSQAMTFYTGPYERTWFYKNKDGAFVMLDKNGDGILDDGIYTDIYTVTAEDIAEHSTRASSKYNVDPAVNAKIPDDFVPTVIVKNGKIVKGEGFCHFQYVHTYSYADGTEVEPDSIAKQLDKNGNVVYGMYMPYMVYAELNLGN